MLDAFDPDVGDGGPRDPGQQGPTQGVAERVAETRLQRLGDKLGPIGSGPLPRRYGDVERSTRLFLLSVHLE